MAIRKSRPIQFRAVGVSDAFDATDVMPGAMAALTNLIPAPNERDNWVPRPAPVQLTDFTGFTTPSFGEAVFTNGVRTYGWIQSGKTAGKSEPFIYDVNAFGFVTITGVTSTNVPTSTANTGDWTPPNIEQVGSYVLFTHPGYALPNAFGWLDMSGFSEATTGNTNTSTLITGNPVITGVNPGMTISDGGVDIPAGTRVVSTAPFVLVESGTTHTNTTLDGLASTAGLAVGQTIAGAGIPLGTTISTVGAGSVTMSQAATASATVQVTFAGATITMSAAATGSHSAAALTIAGGTFASPLWAAGNLNTTPLIAVPTWVTNYAGCAVFAVNKTTSPPSAAVVFSDAGNPLNCANTPNSQIITFQNNIAVTGLVGLPLNNAVSGGILQSLIAIQGDSALWQITGSPATSNLVINSLNDSIGTHAPNSVCATPKGLLLACPDGIRRINTLALIGEPIGQRGDGLTTPFMFATNPGRICAAYNESVYRISVQNGAVTGTPTQEYWYHEDIDKWSGPHTLAPSVIAPFQPHPHGYVFFAAGVPAKLFRGAAFADLAATYVENGTQMVFKWQTSLLPDTQQMQMNTITDAASLAIAVPARQLVQVTATDEHSNVIGVAQLDGDGSAPALWGTMVWGTGNWGAGSEPFYQHHVIWSAPMVFKQMQVALTGNCAGGLKVGSLNMRYSELGYNLMTPTVAAA